MSLGADEVTRPAPAVDGRTARGERTRRALAQALIDLLEEGDPQPTARRVAERAGVSLRSVFHHFENLETLLGAAVAIQSERHWGLIRSIPVNLPVEVRISRLVEERAGLFEAISPVRRYGVRAGAGSPAIGKMIASTRQVLRLRAQAIFAPEFETLPADEVLTHQDALDVATSWETWEQLRQYSGCSPESARRAMELLLTSILAPLAAPPTGGRA